VAGTPGHVAQLAIQAGNDMLLMSPDLPNAYNALLAISADEVVSTT
jgi:beta-glucosidase-like glycosyl hydrolase